MQKSKAAENDTPSGKTKWDICFERALQYFDRYGDWNIPVKFVTEDGIPLGMWCHNVRKRYASGQLVQEKTDRLKAVHFEFSKPTTRSWNRYYSAAKKYYEQNGHLSVPRGYETEDGLKLEPWIGQQRFAISTGKISAERKAKLEKIRIYLTRSESYFETGVCHIKEYRERFGDGNVPADYTCDDGFHLGNWVMAQRQLYHKKKLSEKKRKILNELNFRWSLHEAIWDESYEGALKYYKRHGSLDSLYTTEEGFRLGRWLAAQRTKYRKGELSEEQIRLLEDIGIRWNPAQETWERNYETVKKYYISHGCHVKPSCYIDGCAIGMWLKMQQTAYYDGRLTDEKRILLEEIKTVSARRSLTVMTESLARPTGDAV